MTRDDEESSENRSSGATSLDGYLYQLDVSVWAALDLLLAKKLAQSLVLEPAASQEDLEAQLSDDDPGALAAKAALPSALLVVQAKLRNTGPWRVGDFERLLTHGTERMPAAERLKDPRVNYLLVTSADVDGVLRSLRRSQFGERPKTSDLPPTIAAVVPAEAGGRIGVLASTDQERVESLMRRLLEDTFRVPHTRLEECKNALRNDALARMRGAGGGTWTREEVERVIREHDGYLASSPEAETFVRPTNWNDLRGALHANHAVIITGASGTGKTTAAKMLLEELRGEVPGLTPVYILHGPEEVRGYTGAGPVAFFIEDPWGRYRLEPRSAPWNDELGKLLPTANGNRWFIITSRSDVLAESQPATVSKRWNVRLEAENYGPGERVRLFEHRLPGLPRPSQGPAAAYRKEALDRLRSPLEIQKYFDNLAQGRLGDENDRVFVERCITGAHQQSIESAIVQQVTNKEAWAWAAIVWGLLEARSMQSRGLLTDIQAGLAEKDRTLEDGLDPFVNFLVNGRSLRQAESVFSYYHPRVEAGLEAAMAAKPGLASRVLGYLVDVLVDLDTDGSGDWGRESAANLMQALRRQEAVPPKISPKAQDAVDGWIAGRLSVPGETFSNDLSLASDAGSPSSTAAQVARWLLHMTRSSFGFGDTWGPEPDSAEWYERMASDPLTAKICDGFVRLVLPNQREWYPDDFSDFIARLSQDITPAFVAVASENIGRGYDANADTIAHGAVKDLAGIDSVVAEAIAFEDKLRAKPQSEVWLAISNGEYSEDYAEHLAESHWEEGHSTDVLLKAYVNAVRARKGWSALRDDPRVEGLRRAWISVLRTEEGAGDEAEFAALAEKSFDSRDEQDFWSLAAARWHDSLAPKLLERMIAGHADLGLRVAAAKCFARHAGGLSGDLIKGLLSGDERRAVELLLDLGTARQDRDDRPWIASFAQTILQSLPQPLGEVADAVFASGEPPPVLTAPALALIHRIEPQENPELALEKARLLSRAGDDAVDLIVRLIKSEQGDSDANISYAVGAMKLAVTRGLWPQIEAALSHRFADVRQAALEALAARNPGPLPPELLALASDKGSRVRQALLGLLKARPDPEHVDALLVLAADDWSPLATHYGQDSDYPIAQSAAELLAEPPELPARVFDQTIEISTKTEDSDVRTDLLTALAHNGGAEGVTRVCDIAVSRENAPLSAAASWALFLGHEKVDQATAARLTVAQVTRRGAAIAVPMAMVAGACGSEDQVLATAQALSTDANRKALLLPLAFGASAQGSELCEKVVTLLPLKQVALVRAALNDGRKLTRDVLDDLGDVRIVQEVLKRLHILFFEGR